LASQTSVSIEFVPDCSWIVQCLQISLSQSSSVRTNPVNVLVLVAQITLRQSSNAGARIDLSCGLRHPMKLVPFATRVRMDVKAFPIRPSVPLLITNSQRLITSFDIVYDSNEIPMDYVIRKFLFSCSRWHSAFSTVLMFFLVTQVRNSEDESRILNDIHRIT
ncbi:hypothetical protein T12_12065, partial [Trichinella patagoniensis]